MSSQLIDDEHDREQIVEGEINNTQVIRFLKVSKLEFNFLEKVRPKVRESDRETITILKYETNKWTWNGYLERERKKEGRKSSENFSDSWIKRPRNCWMWNQ